MTITTRAGKGAPLTNAEIDGNWTDLVAADAAETAARSAHSSDQANPHGTTKAQVGLGNVDNTSDANKPVSTAQAAADAAKMDKAANLSDLNNAATAWTNLNAPAQVRSTVATGLSTADATDATAADTFLVIVGKLQAKWNALAASVRAVTLTGLSTATSAVISSADTVLSGLGKLQAQINAISSSVLTTVLTGVDVTTKGTVDASKTVLQAVGLLQASKADVFVEVLVTSNRAITAADFGKILVNNGATNYALTLPTGLAPTTGAAFGLKRTSTGTLILSAGTGTPTITDLPGATVPQNYLDFVQWSAAEVYNYVVGLPAGYSPGGADVTVADGGTGRSTSTTAYGLIAAGTTATGALQTLAAGATTDIIVGGGASALPVWTTATGSGAPVRATSPTLVTPALGVATATSLNGMTTPGSSGALGYLESPINSQSAAYTLVLADSGKTIYHPSADTTARTWTIPANASVAYPVGTVIVFDNDISAGALTIAITTDTMVLVGAAGSTGSRTLAAGGKATAQKVTSTRWRISGTAELT